MGGGNGAAVRVRFHDDPACVGENGLRRPSDKTAHVRSEQVLRLRVSMQGRARRSECKTIGLRSGTI